MNSAIERLLTLRAVDVMNRNVITVSANQSMTRAARAFVEGEISGAPVVDEQGRCVGVLSSRDFVRRAGTVPEEHVTAPGQEHALVQESPTESFHIDEVPDVVRNYMTTAVQTIPEEASMMEMARVLCSEHVHRLIVVDEESRPSGVVTSLDLVAAVVNAIEE